MSRTMFYCFVTVAALLTALAFVHINEVVRAATLGDMGYVCARGNGRMSTRAQRGRVPADRASAADPHNHADAGADRGVTSRWSHGASS